MTAMDEVFFELPYGVAATLRHYTNNEQKRIDEIIDLALRNYLKSTPNV